MDRDSLMDLVMLASAGNPGAAAFCMEAITVNGFDISKTIAIIERMVVLDITGDKLYMIWNDCCDRDTAKAIKVMLENSKDDLLKHLNYENGRGVPYES